jgi:hypothetical protein
MGFPAKARESSERQLTNFYYYYFCLLFCLCMYGGFSFVFGSGCGVLARAALWGYNACYTVLLHDYSDIRSILLVALLKKGSQF